MPVERYELAVNVFAARLDLVICGLHQDQLMQVFFRATFPTWYKK